MTNNKNRINKEYWKSGKEKGVPVPNCMITAK